MKLDFCVVDVDAGVSLADRMAYASAQQVQVQQHIAPAWDLDRTMCVRVATPDAPARKGEVQIRLIKNAPANMQGALGYHSTLPDGTPVIYVFVGLAQQYGAKWTTVASHEVGEVLGDPYLRRSVQTDKGFSALEVCDAVENDEYPVQVTVNGVTATVYLSNFCTPAWFEPPTDLTGVKFDWMGLCKSAGEVRPGGYAQYFDPQKGWQQVGQMSAYRAHLATLGLGRSVRRAASAPRKRSWLGRLWSWLSGR